MWESTAKDVYVSFGGHGWLAVAMTAVLLAFFSVALAYMLAIGFNLPLLRRWAKEELNQAIASAMLVALVFTFVTGEELGFTGAGATEKFSYGIFAIQNYTEYFAGELVAPGARGKVRPFTVAYAHLRNVIDCIKTKYVDIYERNRATEMIMFMDFGIMIAELRWYIPMQMMLYALYQQMVFSHYMANNYAWAALALYFQLAFLEWVETSMFTVFLPLGIILRILPITRGAGAVLIAIALGLYIVYPLMFVIVVLHAGDPPSGCEKTEIEVEPGEMPCLQDPASFTILMRRALAAPGVGAGAWATGGGDLQRVNMYAYYWPLVILTVVVVFVRSVAPFLGADITEIGRGLFRLI